MDKKVYANGVRFFERSDKQPEFVLGSLIITPEDLQEWVNSNPEHTSTYKGKAQVKFQIKRSKDGKVYLDLDNYKQHSEPAIIEDKDDLPF